MKRFSLLVAALILTVFFCGCEYRAADSSGALPADSPVDSSAENETAEESSEESTDETHISRYAKELVGTWYNQKNICEEWVFADDGTLTIDGEKHSFNIVYSLLKDRFVLRIDSERYQYYHTGDMLVFYDGYGGEDTRLISADSEEYGSIKYTEKLREQCADLLSRYPDNDGWLERFSGTDIPLLANADYIDQSKDSGFYVSTPEELASFCWYVNTANGAYGAMILTADIDLSGYNWAPIGWNGGANDYPFNGYIDGGGHTIKGMTMNLRTHDIGFIGWETFCFVENLRFENANITGGNSVGVCTGQAIGGIYQNVVIENSTVNGSTAGSMLGWDANCKKRNCSADVVVNGEKFDFLSYNDCEKSKIVIENPVEITLDGYTVTRPEVEGYQNLGWIVLYNGEQVLHRNAENELSYTYFMTDSGVYEIYLTAFVSGQYVPISNTVTYTIE